MRIRGSAGKQEGMPSAASMKAQPRVNGNRGTRAPNFHLSPYFDARWPAPSEASGCTARVSGRFVKPREDFVLLGILVKGSAIRDRRAEPRAVEPPVSPRQVHPRRRRFVRGRTPAEI